MWQERSLTWFLILLNQAGIYCMVALCSVFLHQRLISHYIHKASNVKMPRETLFYFAEPSPSLSRPAIQPSRVGRVVVAPSSRLRTQERKRATAQCVTDTWVSACVSQREVSLRCNSWSSSSPLNPQSHVSSRGGHVPVLKLKIYNQTKSKTLLRIPVIGWFSLAHKVKHPEMGLVGEIPTKLQSTRQGQSVPVWSILTDSK